ncbi:4-(cytidine 5'-diphospho)-2-C-methyl-D-erythritol kinase [Aliidiomarina taiwanensis]|uniref:4-diphosphocytidyl-2-C-methyl-D-erythritol kinase n=1 Tax=Aliidiomarina taiwanensis TaxID=946228 RepID=A0A432X9A6_9GAMM|nr:4-(cytidine 5'-diphospho)-2-C-methyl-D-erythritol kinase [Aliidiomarina taiwanensis]RUO43900.1 4-(cytidine 5'-diphospho)-2-C-methyl-D-erythritol kinase [Aliidiomarina taiwanensis]
MSQPDLILPAPAKLNLFLHITGQRDDGYHLLETLFQFLSVGDTLAFSRTNTGDIQLTPGLPQVADEDNLIVKAARALLPYRLHTQAGIKIELTKRLPMGGGLGGGSSDAATTLLALNALWDIHLPLEKLAAIGLELGADVPIFVHGFAALARGVGEQLTPMHPEESWYFIVHPNVEVSTAQIFTHPNLPRNTAPLKDPQINWADHHNDCENLVKSLHPQVALAHNWLLEYGASRMTGTGACLFAPFTSKEAAQHALNNMPASFTGFIAQGLNTSPAHLALNAALVN